MARTFKDSPATRYENRQAVRDAKRKAQAKRRGCGAYSKALRSLEYTFDSDKNWSRR